MLDSYWAELLRDQLPDDSPLLASVRRQTAFVAEAPQERLPDVPSTKNEQDEKSSKGWSRLKFWQSLK